MNKDSLTKKQKEKLQKLTDEIMNLSADVVGDYEKNPSEISGSVVQVNENSPFLEEEWKGSSWKKVIRSFVGEAVEYVSRLKNKNATK
tara:strand:+ start:821 stop:1084 length:264 start_codon:yes stop_codon:yes gene_type:complete